MDKVRSEDGTSIAFERVGQGPPLIFVVGAFNGRAKAAPLAEALKDRFAVFTYDRRGRGDSGDTRPYAVKREIEDLGVLLEEAGRLRCSASPPGPPSPCGPPPEGFP